MVMWRCGIMGLESELVAVLFALWAAGAGALWLNLPPGGTKCVSEEIQTDNVVLGEYVVVQNNAPNEQHPTITAKVTSPYGNIVHHKEKVTEDKFAFTTTESGNYLACFSADAGVGASVSLDWKIGIAARDWVTVARKEKIEGVELELRKLEMVVQAIHEKLLHLKDKESKMRSISESTNARVAWFSIMSLGVCIGVSGLQLCHLKSFFQKKRLI